ncbi:transglycosylase SLT domain-containing protein [Brucella intermedia]|uniref:transglycosylase SLT domain-containing protein n=1 Tax=Brucella intermedia TaxID=94625 RepID=UPI002554D34B|nr:transglycosylase SLT domain-containing protein [Brucella intermedia]MDL2203514.1 transglycosylase SLT domain-containing protein [Brucella intermedia]
MAGFQPSIQQAIMQAANRYGIDPSALMRIAQIESGGNPNAKNPTSSAGGLFQFIDGTAKQYGLQNRYDPFQASDAAARLARDNSSYLSGILGRDPSAGELYLAHQQGAGGAGKLLSNPNARAVDILGEKAVRLNGGTPEMTAQEFANKWINKASLGSQIAAQEPSPPQASGTPAPALPDPISVASAPATPMQSSPPPPPGILAALTGGSAPSTDKMSGILSMLGAMDQPQQQPMQLQPMQRQANVPSLADYISQFMSGRTA